MSIVKKSWSVLCCLKNCLNKRTFDVLLSDKQFKRVIAKSLKEICYNLLENSGQLSLKAQDKLLLKKLHKFMRKVQKETSLEKVSKLLKTNQKAVKEILHICENSLASICTENMS